MSAAEAEAGFTPAPIGQPAGDGKDRKKRKPKPPASVAAMTPVGVPEKPTRTRKAKPKQKAKRKARKPGKARKVKKAAVPQAGIVVSARALTAPLRKLEAKLEAQLAAVRVQIRRVKKLA